MTDRKIRTEYRASTAREILRTFRTREEAAVYVTTVRRAGFLTSADAASLTVETVAVNR